MDIAVKILYRETAKEVVNMRELLELGYNGG